MSYFEFLKCANDLRKKIKKKIQRNKMKIEGAYLSDGGEDSAKTWNRRYPTPKEFPQQNWLIFVQALPRRAF